MAELPATERSNPAQLRVLERAAGNRAVGHLLAQRSSQAKAAGDHALQTKVGRLQIHRSKESDKTSFQPVSRPFAPASAVPRTVQASAAASEVAPATSEPVQRWELDAEEPLQGKFGTAQRVEEGELLQRKTGAAQRQKEAAGGLQMKAVPEPFAPQAVRIGAAVVQRHIVQQATIPGMAGPLDTAQPLAAKQLINQLFDSGRRDSLLTLYSQILQNDPHNNELKDYIGEKIQATPSAEPANQTSGIYEKLALKVKYMFAGTPNQGVQTGLRMWVSGDPARGIGWNMICKHLRGQLSTTDYEGVGTLHYMIEDKNNNTALASTYTSIQKVQAAKQVLDAAVQAINGSLGALPAHDNVSYRQSKVASATTYGTTINVGDVIRDKAFWSTSALRISGSAGGWGTNGTINAPKVYFLITGSTGKYISKYAAQEEGQHEVLFEHGICFRVDRIANYGNHTFFVNLTEVAAVAVNAAKNPYDGTPA